MATKLSHITQVSPMDAQKMLNSDMGLILWMSAVVRWTLFEHPNSRKRDPVDLHLNKSDHPSQHHRMFYQPETDIFRIKSRHIKKDIKNVICFSTLLCHTPAAIRVGHRTSNTESLIWWDSLLTTMLLDSLTVLQIIQKIYIYPTFSQITVSFNLFPKLQ